MKNKPNIIVFFTDQQRWDTSGLHGNPLSLMENFDHYAQEGTHLFNSFTCQPVCGPARASLQTGKYATKTGVFRNHITLNKNQKTLAQYLNKEGYETAYIGKWHLGSSDPVKKMKEVDIIIGLHQIYLNSLLTLTTLLSMIKTTKKSNFLDTELMR